MVLQKANFVWTSVNYIFFYSCRYVFAAAVSIREYSVVYQCGRSRPALDFLWAGRWRILSSCPTHVARELFVNITTCRSCVPTSCRGRVKSDVLISTICCFMIRYCSRHSCVTQEWFIFVMFWWLRILMEMLLWWERRMLYDTFVCVYIRASAWQ